MGTLLAILVIQFNNLLFQNLYKLRFILEHSAFPTFLYSSFKHTNNKHVRVGFSAVMH